MKEATDALVGLLGIRLSWNLFKRGTYTSEVHKEEEGIISSGVAPDTSAVCRQEGKGIAHKRGRRSR